MLNDQVYINNNQAVLCYDILKIILQQIYFSDKFSDNTTDLLL